MSGDSATLALSTGSTIFSALQGAQQAEFANANAAAQADIAQAQSEAAAHQIEAQAAIQATTLGRQASAREFQASQLGRQAELTRARTALRKAQEQREGRRRQGRRRAAFAGRGITRRGSPTEVLADAAAEEALNLALIEFEGETRAVQAEQAEVLRRHEADLLTAEAGLVQTAAQRRASFVRSQGRREAQLLQSGGADPLMAGVASGLNTAVSTGLPEMIGSMFAGGPATSSSRAGGGSVEIEAGTGARSFTPRRRSLFQRSLLS